MHSSTKTLRRFSIVAALTAVLAVFAATPASAALYAPPSVTVSAPSSTPAKGTFTVTYKSTAPCQWYSNYMGQAGSGSGTTYTVTYSAAQTAGFGFGVAVCTYNAGTIGSFPIKSVRFTGFVTKITSSNAWLPFFRTSADLGAGAAGTPWQTVGLLAGLAVLAAPATWVTLRRRSRQLA
jgi:hypothetical protein